MTEPLGYLGSGMYSLRPENDIVAIVVEGVRFEIERKRMNGKVIAVDATAYMDDDDLEPGTAIVDMGVLL